MKLSSDMVASTARAAPAAGVDQASLTTVIEVEPGGRPFEAADLDPSDGIEQAMLFEQHGSCSASRSSPPTSWPRPNGKG